MFSILSAVVLRGGLALTMGGEHGVGISTVTGITRSRAYTEVLSDAWKFIITASSIMMLIMLVISVAQLFTGEGITNQEYGLFYKYIFFLLWFMLIIFSMLLLGNCVLGTSHIAGEVEVGAFNGALLFFPGPAILFPLLFAHFFHEESWNEYAGLPGSFTFSLLCLVLSVSYVVFAVGLFKYRQFVVMANAEDGKSAHEDFVNIEEAHSEESDYGNDNEWGTAWKMPARNHHNT